MSERRSRPEPVAARADALVGESRRLWGVAVAVAALVLLLLVGLLSFNSEREPERWSEGAGAARLAPSQNFTAQTVGLQPIRAQPFHGEGDLVADEALFFDPSPLFLPTRWNAGAVGMPESILQEAEELFEDYAPKLRFAREGVGSGLLGNADSAEARASELVFADEDGVGLSVMGRRAEEPVRLPERSGRLEVVATSAQVRQGNATARRVLVRDLVPPAVPSGAGNWQPLELAAVVDAAGLVGTVTLVQSSGVEAVDEFFRDYVVRELRLGARVGPGIYRILAGP